MPSRRRKQTLAALARADEALQPAQVGDGFPQIIVRLVVPFRWLAWSPRQESPVQV